MNFNQIVSAFEDAGFDVRSYSGRGMYGKECLGVECDDPVACVLDVIGEFANCTDDKFDVVDLVESLRDPSQDSMGLSSILYWPRIKWEGEER
jgi:hypothetical protein